MKFSKKKKILLVAAVMLLTVFSLCGCTKTENKTADKTVTADENISYEIDLHKAILEYNGGKYVRGETTCEGHIELGRENGGEETVSVYLLVSYGEYGFENDYFTKVSGSGVIPSKLSFKQENGKYVLDKYEIPEDGSGYVQSAKKLFPKQYHARILSSDEEDYYECINQEEEQAKEYLESIGRDAEIKEYGEIEHVLLTDLGVSVEVSNSLLERKELANYPYWVGWRECIENGQRVVYRVDYKEGDDAIEYKKYKGDSIESSCLEAFEIDAETGEMTEVVTCG